MLFYGKTIQKTKKRRDKTELISKDCKIQNIEVHLKEAHLKEKQLLD